MIGVPCVTVPCAKATPDRPASSGKAVVDHMNEALAEVESEVESSPYWRYITGEGTPDCEVMAFMREVMLEIWSYQKRVDEAVFSAVGRLGTSINEQGLIRSMIAVQIEETGHGTLALGDYVALGGDEGHARSRRPSPAAQALIGTISYLSEREHPLCHLGFMYFFERFTTMMTVKIAPILERARFPEERLRFMKLHAEEDIRHADMLANVIAECEADFHGAREHILFGFETFRVIYPHQIWQTALDRSLGRS